RRLIGGVGRRLNRRVAESELITLAADDGERGHDEDAAIEALEGAWLATDRDRLYDSLRLIRTKAAVLLEVRRLTVGGPRIQCPGCGRRRPVRGRVAAGRPELVSRGIVDSQPCRAHPRNNGRCTDPAVLQLDRVPVTSGHENAGGRRGGRSGRSACRW